MFLKLDYDDNQYNEVALSVFFWCNFCAASQITYTIIYQSKQQKYVDVSTEKCLQTT